MIKTKLSHKKQQSNCCRFLHYLQGVPTTIVAAYSIWQSWRLQTPTLAMKRQS